MARRVGATRLCLLRAAVRSRFQGRAGRASRAITVLAARIMKETMGSKVRRMPPRPSDNSGCPICGSLAQATWVEERETSLVDCAWCGTFTITPECEASFRGARRLKDNDMLLTIRCLSAYLRHAGEDDERDITTESWRGLAVEGGDSRRPLIAGTALTPESTEGLEGSSRKLLGWPVEL